MSHRVPPQTAQVGDVVVLLIQFMQNGVIVNLSTATGLMVLVQYPDGTRLSFAATLYTNGLDGIIAYRTLPNDLAQAGTYFIQGHAVVNGQVLYTRNNQLDNQLYVYENILAVSTPVYTGFLAVDTNAVSWLVTVGNASGNLYTKAPPYSSARIYPGAVTLVAPNGAFWAVTARPNGGLLTTAIADPGNAIAAFYMTGLNNRIWQVTVLDSGNLDTN